MLFPIKLEPFYTGGAALRCRQVQLAGVLWERSGVRGRRGRGGGHEGQLRSIHASLLRRGDAATLADDGSSGGRDRQSDARELPDCPAADRVRRLGLGERATRPQKLSRSLSLSLSL